MHMWQFAIVNLYQKRQSSQMKNSEVWLDIEDCYAVETCYDKGGVGEVLTPILVLPWRGGSAAQRGTAPCNAVHFCAMLCLHCYENNWVYAAKLYISVTVLL